jgi:hypothetical protein
MDETEARLILEDYVREAEETFAMFNIAHEDEERKVIEAIKTLLNKR